MIIWFLNFLEKVEFFIHIFFIIWLILFTLKLALEKEINEYWKEKNLIKCKELW